MQEQIEISQVVVEKDRFRKDLGDISELIASIKSRGVIVPIVIERNTNLLIAGERRITSAKKAGLTSIPFIYRDQADELTRKEIEFEENLHRKDFTDAEKAKAMLELHRLKTAKYGTSFAGDGGVKGPTEAWTTGKTADAVGVSKATASTYIQVAEYLEKNPEDKDVKSALRDSAKQAYKVILHKREQKVKEMLASRRVQKAEMGQDEVMALASSMLKHSPCELGIVSIPSESIDFIYTDPPYGIEADKVMKTRSSAGNFDGYKDDTPDKLKSLWDILPKELYRVAKPDAFCFIWCGFTNKEAIETRMIEAGWEISPVPFIWVKVNSSWQCNTPHLWPASACDCAIIAKKGNPILVQQGKPNFALCPTLPSNDKTHFMERPFALHKDVLERYMLPGQVLLDCFAGSFSSGKAAIKMGLNALGFEKDASFYSSALLHLAETIKSQHKES